MKISWPTALVLSLVVVAVTVAALVGPKLGLPAEYHIGLLASLAGFGAFVLSQLRPLITRDDDGDGIVNIFDPDFWRGRRD